MEPEAIDAKVREILEREEFRDLHNDAAPATQLIGELLQSITRAIQALVGDLRANHPGVFVLLLIFGTVVIAASVYYGARGAARRKFRDVNGTAELPELLRGDPVHLRAEAENAAREERWLDAARLEFRASIIERALSEGTLAKLRDADGFRRARTYRELAEEFARNAAQKDRLQNLAGRIEKGLYAGETFSRQDYEHVRVVLEAR